MLINRAYAREIFDSRKEPTIEIFVNGSKASSPSGKSTGKYETQPYHKSLQWNINFINKIKFNLEINSFFDLKKLEYFIKEKAKLKNVKQFGANALFALESAILKALAKKQKKELWQIFNNSQKKMPVPVGNAVGGGLHSHNKDKPVFQEFLLIPKGKSFYENYLIMKKIHGKLKELVNGKEQNDEGAWETSLDNEKILEILSGFKEIKIGVDIAASSFFIKGNYLYKNKIIDREMQINYVNYLIKKFNLFYIEDPLEEKDFLGFSRIYKSINNLVVGDDLTATNISRLKKSIKTKSINAIIIKPNQNGSLLELAEIFEICKKNNIKTIFSHRSGETMDNAIADLAVGFGADFIKCGISTKWREAKLKRLVEIETKNNL